MIWKVLVFWIPLVWKQKERERENRVKKRDDGHKAVCKQLCKRSTVSERTGNRSFSFLSTKSGEHEKHHSSLVFNTLERIESRHTLDDELTEKLREQTDEDDNEENTEDWKDIPD